MKTENAIIIQARTGSARLPGKVLLPFHKSLSILDIIIAACKTAAGGWRVIVATSDQKADDGIADCAITNGVAVFRGSENDVLDRFIGAADFFSCRKIVRVCADNPLLDAALLKELIIHGSDSAKDYCSFEVAPGVPAIRSHWGIFAEYVTAEALRKAAALTTEPLWREHVTNYIYNHGDIFTLEWIQAPTGIFGRTDIRFTIDTQEDFSLVQRIYAYFAERGINPNFRDAIRLVDENPEWLAIMKSQIDRFSK